VVLRVCVFRFLVLKRISSFFHQVRFVYETFKKMRPGVPLMELHGQQKQQKRLGIFYDFCKKQSACLFATDVGGCFHCKLFSSRRQSDDSAFFFLFVLLTTQPPADLTFQQWDGLYRLIAPRMLTHTSTELGELPVTSRKGRLSSSCCPRRRRV